VITPWSASRTRPRAFNASFYIPPVDEHKPCTVRSTRGWLPTATLLAVALPGLQTQSYKAVDEDSLSEMDADGIAMDTAGRRLAWPVTIASRF